MPKYVKPAPGAPILVDIGGQKLELVVDFEVMITIERDHGISMLKDESLVPVLQSPKLLGALLLAALQVRQPQITAEWLNRQLKGRISDDLLPYLVYAWKEVWLDALVARLEGRPEMVPSPPPPAGAVPAVPTGSRSGRSEDTTSALVSLNSGG